jgi:hypothetical protein
MSTLLPKADIMAGVAAGDSSRAPSDDPTLINLVAA